MEFRKDRLTIKQAKETDLVDYLASLGFFHDPKKSKGDIYWYCSPFNAENTPSFKVNRKMKLWVDFSGSARKGGDLILFGTLYHKCTIAEFLDKLSTGFSLREPGGYVPARTEPEAKIKVISEAPIKSPALLNYLKRRGIDLAIAHRYCKEVRFEIGDKTYYGIGFKNDSGGFEIRNPYMKSSSSPKVNTSFNNGSKTVVVFEGFMDFLTFLTLYKNAESSYNFTVLNGTALFTMAQPFLESHESIHLYLDRGKGGETTTAYALSLSNKYKDESHIYKDHDDLNNWFVNFGKSQKKQQRKGIS